MARLPSMQFYGHDWLSDPALRRCALNERGLWIDMLCVLWDAPERGVSPYEAGLCEAKAWAKVVGHRTHFVRKLISQLEFAEVFSRRETDQRIYSRRMVRDELVRSQHRNSYYRTKTEFGSNSDGIRTRFGFDSSSSSSTSNLRPPLPPVNGGPEIAFPANHDEMLKDEKNYSYMPWSHGHIVIKTGKHRRVLTKTEIDSLAGSAIEHVVEVIRGKGFWAEIYQVNGKGAHGDD